MGTSCFEYTKASICDSHGCNGDGGCKFNMICNPTLRDANNNLYCTFNSSSIAGDYMYYGCVDLSNDYEILKIPSWRKPPKNPVVGKTPGSGDVIQPK